MKELLVEATINALSSVNESRFFHSERGYQGKFYCSLQSKLDDKREIFVNGRILELEHQKAVKRHSIKQRPDIILHTPVEESGAHVIENNIAVWALKLATNDEGARCDFKKLDVMMNVLNYSFGFFININSDNHFLNIYDGQNRKRLTFFAVERMEEKLRIKKAFHHGDSTQEELIEVPFSV